MISISSRGSATEATKYYEHMASEYGPADYYSRESAGQFAGAGLAALSIEPGAPTDAESFTRLAEGRDPRTGADLVQHAGEEHRSGWDVTLSPPKSVSTIWGLAGQETRERIEAAHQVATVATLSYLEHEAGYTRRGGGWRSEAERREKIDGFIVAQYRHGTSREADPQLHSHMMVFNLAHRADGTWGSLNPREIYTHQSAAGAIYSAALAHEMQRQGYAVEREGREFEVVGVPQDLRDEFSTRREQIKEELAERGASGSRASERATLATRRAKEVRDIDSLRDQWAERSRERVPDWSPEQVRGIEQPSLDPVPTDAEILRTLAEQRSTFAPQDVTASLGISGIGTLTPAQIEDRSSRVLADPEVVHLTGHDGLPRYTTREILDIERGMVERAARMARAESHPVDAAALRTALDSRPTLSDEQRQAIGHITAPGGVALVQGGAGTGKTFALAAAREAWVAAGFRVRGAALAGKAAEGLESGSGIQSGTLHSLLRDTAPETILGVEYSARDPLRAGDVVVADEAGMVGSRQLADLLARAEGAGAKVVLVGDARQLQAIDAGAAFRAVQERTGSVGLDNIIRQRADADRQAVRDLRDGRAKEALENLAARDRVHEYKTGREGVAGVGKAVAADLAAGKSSVAVAATRAEVRFINKSARTEAIERGLVEKAGAVVETGTGAREFAVGDRIITLRNDRDLQVKNGDFGTVTKIERSGDESAPARITMRLDRDQSERVIDTGKYDHLDHGYAATAHKLQGATVDNTHILASDSRMSSREWAYVAGSRHKEEVHVYGEKHAIHDLAPDWSRAKQKDTSVDYRLSDHESPLRDHETPEKKAPTREPKREREIAERPTPDRLPMVRPQSHEPPQDYRHAREAMDTLREYQRAADIHRQARWQERLATREPDREKAKEMRDAADRAHARAEGIRAQAARKENLLPKEYRDEVHQSEHQAARHEREATRQEDKGAEHYRDAGSALARAQDPRASLIGAVGAAAEYREEKWKAERARAAAKDETTAGREARREGADLGWDQARAANAARQVARADSHEHQQHQLER